MSHDTNPPCYSSYDGEAMASYDTNSASGLPALAPPTPPTRTQYSNMGRMEPEFLGGDTFQENSTENERNAVARGFTTNVLGFSPREGQSGTTIVIQFVFRENAIPRKTKVSLRLMIGNIPLRTSIFGVPPTDDSTGHWQLEAMAPNPIELKVAGIDVPLILQVLNVADSTIVDDVCIGTFKFVSGNRLGNKTRTRSIRGKDVLFEEPEALGRIEDISASETVDLTSDWLEIPRGRKRARLSIEVPRQDIPDDLNNEFGPPSLSPVVARTLSAQSSQKAREGKYRATIKFHGSLVAMTRNWSDDEFNDSRRLVEFVCNQDRGRINVRFAPIYGNGALDTEINVVSCIWWEEAEDFVITSVDTISLLEKLVGTKFSTEEKNRIRRNLQAFKPSTISKSQPDSEGFFKMLMEFPPPRPRNIEKDVKAFSWSKLSGMLEKVISKYWFVTSPGGSDSDEQSASYVRVVRDPETVFDDNLDAVGSAFSTTSPIQASSSNTHVQLDSEHLAITPSPENSSSSRLEPLDVSQSHNPGMDPHDCLTFGPTEVFMESGEHIMCEDPIQMDVHGYIYDAHLDHYSNSLELSLGQDQLVHGAGVGVGQGVDEDMSFTAHTINGYP